MKRLLIMTAGGIPNSPVHQLQHNTTLATVPNAFIFVKTFQAGHLKHEAQAGVSGLAASTRKDYTYWTINDIGARPEIFTVNTNGICLGYAGINTPVYFRNRPENPGPLLLISRC
ncbi:MAG: hypothetical protein GY874_20390 [Desulfobacteraceae bacterium]|nr:hypothetical protein [Desulfobacteraceae bacterium]